MTLAPGCAQQSSVGALRAESLREGGAVLPSQCVVAFFDPDPRGSASFMLADVPVERVLAGDLTEGQLLHIELLWLPKPGATPMDSSAANTSVRYVIVSGGEVGVYGGLGFAAPADDLEGERVTVNLAAATLQLLDATPGFVDLLSPVNLAGSFTAVKDERRTRELNYAASQLVTNALGRTRYVRAESEEREEASPNVRVFTLRHPDCLLDASMP